MDLSSEELERMMLIDSAKQRAEAEYKCTPQTAENLTKWGGVLLELAHLEQGQDSIDMLKDAAAKFEEAIKIDPKKHDAYWGMGNAYTTQGFMMADMSKANGCFKKATRCFQNAFNEDPQNELYQKALEMSDKAPTLYRELKKQMASEQVDGSPVSMSSRGGSKGKGKKKKQKSDLKYDILGWVILATGLAALFAMSKPALPATN